VSEGGGSVPAAGNRIEFPALIRLDPVLSLQRTAVRAFLEAERARSNVESEANAGHTAAVCGANDAATFRCRAAAEILERVETSASIAVSAASEQRDAAVNGEIQLAVKQADDARERALPALERIGMGWVLDTERAPVPAAPDAAAQLGDAVGRTEAAVQPVIDAVNHLEEWRRIRKWLLSYSAIAVAIVLIVGGIVRTADRARAGEQRATGQRAPATLAPDDERAAILDIRRTVREIDGASSSMARRHFAGYGGLSGAYFGAAYLADGNVRKVVFRHNRWVTETYYTDADVIFRYEHLPQPSAPTDGLRYYYRAGVPVRLREDTINLVPGTVQYSNMNAESVRIVALQEMRDVATWSVSP
jgi:hypothetical protein